MRWDEDEDVDWDVGADEEMGENEDQHGQVAGRG